MLEIYILLSLRKNIATVSGRTSLTLGITYVKLKQILNNINEMKILTYGIIKKYVLITSQFFFI